MSKYEPALTSSLPADRNKSTVMSSSRVHWNGLRSGLSDVQITQNPNGIYASFLKTPSDQSNRSRLK